MLTISQSVGKNGANISKDLRLVQVALYETGLLAKKDFASECLDGTVLQPVQDLKEKVLNLNGASAVGLHDITAGNEKISAAKIPKTIEAIAKFQKEKLGAPSPDGRIDPNGRTLAKLSALFADAMRSKNFGFEPFCVTIEGDKITLKLSGPNKDATKVFSAAASREFLLKNYTWNGLVKLMKKAFELNKEPFSTTTHLTGTTSDNAILLPEQGIAHIIRLQMRHAISIAKPTDDNLDELLRSVDGFPGNGFSTKILKAKNLVTFLDESGNKSLKTLEEDLDIKIPKISADEAVLYDFFRDIVRTRNGLWSDVPGVVNIVGLRRIVDSKQHTGYNDTLAVCFTGEDVNGTLQKRVEINLASTEPGNRVLDRQLVAQTLLLVPGYHNIRQPAGRTRNAVKQERNVGSLTWNEGDTTMNFHQGANNFTYPGATGNARKLWLMKYGINEFLQKGMTGAGWDEKTVFDLNLVLSEIYLLLSQYGLDGTKAPYQNLSDLSKIQLIEIQEVANGKVQLKQGDGAAAKTKTVDLAVAKHWAVDYWFGRKSKDERFKFTSILQKLGVFDEATVASWEQLKKEEIVQSLTDDIMVEVVKTQARFLKNIEEVDGKPGQTFAEIISGVHPSLVAAKTDKLRLDELLKKLEGFALKNVADLQQKLKTSLFLKTTQNRLRIYNETKYDPRLKLDVVQNASVGPYSQGCQIIFDTEIFYQFWTKLLQRAAAVGQTRWYYTLIDATDWKTEL